MKRHQKACPTPFVSLPDLFATLTAPLTPFPAIIFTNKLAPNALNDKPRNTPFYISFSIVSVTAFIS